VVFGQPIVPTGELPLSVAESSEFTKTATFDEVWEWLRRLQSLGAQIHVTTVGTTTEGRSMPLVIASRPLVTTPEQAWASGKPILYLQGNIHGGEVEGKDALLMLLRDLTLGDARDLLDDVIVLSNPIYNADGNEKWGPVAENRRSQDGPGLVGLRPNGMGLDLNRDYIKAESPEMRSSLAGIFNRWWPDLVMDLHTTNGSYHAFDLTYAASLTPIALSGPVALANDELLPELERRLAANEHPIFDYGNFNREYPPTEWRTFSWEPRFGTNYLGLRGAISILSESVSYRPFRTRLSATYWLVRETIAYAGANADEITSVTRGSRDQVTAWGREPDNAPALGVRFELASRGKETLSYEILDPPPIPGESRGTRTGRYADAELEIMTVFRATKTRPFPAGYLIPPAFPEAVTLLRRHGIGVDRLESKWSGTVRVFRVETISAAENLFQGHRALTVDGDYRSEAREVPAGWYFVPTSQPLGILVFTLLEPEMLDGLTSWNYFDRGLTADQDAPVLKLMSTPRVARTRLPPDVE
jgi:hypothetical protein